MWVTKLMISQVKKRIFCPKTTKFGPKLAFLVNLGQAMQAYSVPCWWVGWWLWRELYLARHLFTLSNTLKINSCKLIFGFAFLEIVFPPYSWTIGNCPSANTGQKKASFSLMHSMLNQGHSKKGVNRSRDKLAYVCSEKKFSSISKLLATAYRAQYLPPKSKKVSFAFLRQCNMFQTWIYPDIFVVVSPYS